MQFMNSLSIILNLLRILVKDSFDYAKGQSDLKVLAKMLFSVFIKEDLPAPTIPIKIIFNCFIFLSLNLCGTLLSILLSSLNKGLNLSALN